jgi:hypothetical protein
MSMAHRRSWEPTTLADSLSASFYVIVQALNSRHLVSLSGREILTLVSDSRKTMCLLKEFALITTFSLIYAAGAKIWSLNAATNELTRKSISVFSPSVA